MKNIFMPKKYNETQVKVIEFVYFFLTDPVLFYLSFMGAYYIRFFHGLDIFKVTKGIPGIETYETAAMLAVIIFVTVFVFGNGFSLKRYYFLDEYLRISLLALMAAVIVVAVTFFYRSFSFSRLVLLISLSLMGVLLAANHYLFSVIKKLVITRYLPSKNILIIGLGRIAQRIKATSRKYSRFRFYFTDQFDPAVFPGLLEEKKIDDVILAKFPNTISELDEIISMCEERKIDIKVVPSVMELKLGEVIIDNELGLPMLSIKSIAMEVSNYIQKRIFDIVVTTLILTMLMPVLVIIAAVIKITSWKGPVLFSHKRKGFKGRDFKFYKFRTMINDADKHLDSLKKMSDRPGPVLKIKNDPRIIFVGKILRKISFDEFPQFINVLKGDMSIVGPRPQVLWEAAIYDKVAKRRLNVMPGITGLWQISGRADVSYEEMIELDIFYLENWTLALDMKIILMTLPAIFKGKGAY